MEKSRITPHLFSDEPNEKQKNKLPKPKLSNLSQIDPKKIYESNQSTVNSQILSAITELSSYNSYGDFDASKSGPNDSDIRKTNQTSETRKKSSNKTISSYLEAILKNSMGKIPSEEKICRICLYDSNFISNGPLISPCKCRHGLNYIHEECLKTLLILKKQNIIEPFCGKCKSKIKTVLEFQKVFFPKKILKEGFFPFLIGIFLIISLLSLWLLMAIFIFFYDKPSFTNGSKRNEMYIMMFLSSFLTIFLIISLVTYIKKSFFIKKVKNWKIINELDTSKIEIEEVNSKSFFKWCPLSFFKKKKSEAVDKISEKYEINIIRIEESLVQYANENIVNNISNNIELVQNFDKQIEGNMESAKFNFSNLPLETFNKKNFTFRTNDGASNIKPSNPQEETKDQTNLDKNKQNLINDNKIIEIPILRSRNIVPLKNTFQKSFKKIFKKNLLNDFDKFDKTLNKDFFNFQSSKTFQFKIILIIHAYSLQYIQEIQRQNGLKKVNVKEERSRQRNHPKPNLNSSSNKKKPLCLKKKLTE